MTAKDERQTSKMLFQVHQFSGTPTTRIGNAFHTNNICFIILEYNFISFIIVLEVHFITKAKKIYIIHQCGLSAHVHMYTIRYDTVVISVSQKEHKRK